MRSKAYQWLGTPVGCNRIASIGIVSWIIKKRSLLHKSNPFTNVLSQVPAGLFAAFKFAAHILVAWCVLQSRLVWERQDRIFPGRNRMFLTMARICVLWGASWLEISLPGPRPRPCAGRLRLCPHSRPERYSIILGWRWKPVYQSIPTDWAGNSDVDVANSLVEYKFVRPTLLAFSISACHYSVSWVNWMDWETFCCW